MRTCCWGDWTKRPFWAAAFHLDRERAMRMLRAQKGSSATVEEFAAGIFRVIDTEMEKATRVVSVERGHDPHEFPRTARLPLPIPRITSG